MSQRHARLIVLACTALISLSGCGGNRQLAAVQLKIKVHWARLVSHHVDAAFTLSCRPTGGTLPDAARICADIARYPDATLIPKWLGDDRWVCGGSPFGPFVTISVRENGSTYSFTGESGCGWPAGTALALYMAATQRSATALTRIESTLRCAEDPRLLARPTPLVSAVACVHGLWTPHTERLIRIAVKAVPLTGKSTATLFPSDIGVQDCAFRSGGLAFHLIHGRCQVNVTKVWSAPTVTFVEAWTAAGHVRRARWVIRVTGRHTKLIAHSGSIPPQDWM